MTGAARTDPLHFSTRGPGLPWSASSRPRTPATLSAPVPRRVVAEGEEGCRRGCRHRESIHLPTQEVCHVRQRPRLPGIPCPAGKEAAFVPFHHPRRRPDSKTAATTGVPNRQDRHRPCAHGRTASFVRRCITDRTHCMRSPAPNGSSNVRQSSRRLCPFLHNTGFSTFLSVWVRFPCNGCGGRPRAIDTPSLWSKLSFSVCGRDGSETAPS